MLLADPSVVSVVSVNTSNSVELLTLPNSTVLLTTGRVYTGDAREKSGASRSEKKQSGVDKPCVSVAISLRKFCQADSGS